MAWCVPLRCPPHHVNDSFTTDLPYVLLNPLATLDFLILPPLTSVDKDELIKVNQFYLPPTNALQR